MEDFRSDEAWGTTATEKWIRVVDSLREPQVHKLQALQLVRNPKHDVLRLYVAVHDVVLVHEG